MEIGSHVQGCYNKCYKQANGRPKAFHKRRQRLGYHSHLREPIETKQRWKRICRNKEKMMKFYKVLRDTLHFDSKTESSGIAEVADIRWWLQKGFDDRWRTSLVRLVSTLSIRPGLQRRQATWRKPWKTMVKRFWRIQKERLFLPFIEWYIESCDRRNNAVVSCRLIVRILCRIKKQLVRRFW